MLQRILGLIFFAYTSLTCTDAYSSELGDAAAGLAPGDWTIIETSGFNSNLLLQGNGHYALEYTDSLKWDPVRREVNFVGSGHIQPYTHIVYEESTNGWGRRSLPSYFGDSHGYDHMAIDPIGRKFFFRQFNGRTLEIYDLDNRSWSRSSTATTNILQVAGALAWFPERNGVIVVDAHEISLYEPESDNWQSVSKDVEGLGPYQNFAEYSSKHNLVIYGGGAGSSALFQVNSGGVVTRMKDAPFPLGIYRTVIVEDPASGNFLVFNNDALYEYDPIADSWQLQNVTIPIRGGSDPGVFGAAAVPISTYGIIMIVMYDGDNSKVFLYRHAAGGGLPIPPPPPPPPPGPPPPDTTAANADWLERSTAPGVLMATGFDTLAEVDDYAFSLKDHISWHQTNKASGNGSLRFEILNNDVESSGSWLRHLSDDQREFDTGDTFYVQYRQYFPAYFASHPFSGTTGGGFAGGWKQSIISNHEHSATLFEVVLQNTRHRGYIQGYNRNTTGTFLSWDDQISTPCNPSDFVRQNQIDRGFGTDTCLNARKTYGGLYSESSLGFGTDTGSADPESGAFVYYPDEWLTFLQKITPGTFGGGDATRDTRIEVWAAREGDVSYTKLIDQMVNLGTESSEVDGQPLRFDAIWLLPFNTGRTADSTRENTFTLYDELIVSTNFINAPSADVSNVTKPAEITDLDAN